MGLREGPLASHNLKSVVTSFTNFSITHLIDLGKVPSHLAAPEL
jgi:hypothetical protein